MSQKENNNNGNNKINININQPIIEGLQFLKNKDNNTIINSNSSSNSKRINDNIILNLLNQNNNINNSKESELKMDHSTDINSIENVKQDIINFYLIEQKKIEEKKKELELNRNLNMRAKKNKNNNRKSKEKNRFEKYDKEKLSYEIYHQYQKLNFEKEKLPFLERMQLYALKKCLQDYKIEELTNIKSPKISEKKIIHTFNRLIEDSNRRNFKVLKKNTNENNKKVLKNKYKENNKNIQTNKIKQSNENYKSNNNKNNKKENNINNNLNNPNKNTIKKKQNYKMNKSFDKQKWDEIYERRFSSKLKERNEKLEKMRQEKEEKKKKEEDTIIDNLNKKQNLITQKYGLKRSHSVNDLSKGNNNYNINNKYYIGNNKMITNINQRLYYNELNKKDIDYKTFMEKAQELLSDNNNDYFYYYGREEKNNDEGKKNIKKNGFRTSAAGPKNKKMVKSNSVYNFKDYLDSNNENKKEEENKNNKSIKIINGKINDIYNNVDNGNNIGNNNYKLSEIKNSGENNADNSKSDFIDLINVNSININKKDKNNSAEKIINRFFEK